MTPEQRQRNSESHKGKTPWNKGRPWSDEEKAKCNGKPVVCVELNRKYRTAHEAGKELNIDFSSICKCVKKPHLTAGGFHWAADNEQEPPAYG